MRADIDLGRICDEVSRMLRYNGHENACITAAALLARVLHILGYTNSYPLTVCVKIFNAAFQRWAEKHGGIDDEASEEACYDAGGFEINVGRGAPEAEDQWAGHLSVLIPKYFDERHALLDLTIIQADRPDVQIVLRPLCLKADDVFIDGKRPLSVLCNDCLLDYQAYPDGHTYGDWKS